MKVLIPARPKSEMARGERTDRREALWKYIRFAV